MSAANDAGRISEPERRSARTGAWRRLLADPSGMFGLMVVVLLVFTALFAGVLAPYDPNAIDVAHKFQLPSAQHLLGTDQLGRDVFSRVLHGGRVALVVALTATFSGAAVGIFFGLVAGYGARGLDNLVVFLFDTMRCFPVIILALAVGPLFGGGMRTVIVIIAVTAIPYYGRIVRTQTLAVKNAEYVLSLRSTGASVGRIILLHILPNIIGPVLILASMDIPIVIAAEAGLSFLGVGVKPPTPSWGLMLDDGFRFVQQTPWLVIAGSIPLVLATLGLTFLGEALRDAFDPKLGQTV
jgi:peptide/nickel transport system permease protein